MPPVGERIHACIQALDRKDADPVANSRGIASLEGTRGCGTSYGSDDMAARTTPKTTATTAEAISTTAFQNPSTISNPMVFHGVLVRRLKRSDIDFFLWAVDASLLQIHPTGWGGAALGPANS
jgi:hypothetical protein